jgi:hypothetical protein
MSANKNKETPELTNVCGITLKSEHADPVLYNAIRSLQFLFLHTYKLWDHLTIEENYYGKTFLYLIENKKLGLRGYVGRDIEKRQIKFLAIDKGRERWMVREGFDPGDPDVAGKIGIMMVLPTMNDFILFLAGRAGWEYKEYLRG